MRRPSLCLVSSPNDSEFTFEIGNDKNKKSEIF